jgi:hypothetical protein
MSFSVLSDFRESMKNRNDSEKYFLPNRRSGFQTHEAFYLKCHARSWQARYINSGFFNSPFGSEPFGRQPMSSLTTSFSIGSLWKRKITPGPSTETACPAYFDITWGN